MGTLLVALLLSTTGTHSRLETAHGPVHVLTVGKPRWTVVYVHGYWTDLDTAWREHRLEAQFLASGLEAVFIAPEAPSGPGQQVRWDDLDALLKTVADTQPEALPTELIVLGHSGAYRTLSQWTSVTRLKTVVLLDAFYGAPATWERWMRQDDGRRLFVLSRATAARAAGVCSAKRARGQVDCQSSPWNHMGIVTEGVALPRYLRLATLTSS